MTIQNIVKISSAIYAGLTIFVCLILVYQFRTMHSEVRRMELSSEIAATIYQLQLLIHDQLDEPGLARIGAQWTRMNENLRSLILTAQNDEEFDRRQIDKMLHDKSLADSIFLKLYSGSSDKPGARMILLASSLSDRLALMESQAQEFKHLYNSRFETAKQRSEYLVGGLSVFIMAVVLLNGRWVNRRIIRPLKIVTRDCLTVGSGNLNHEVHIGSDDELGILAREFNKMTSNLRNTHFKLSDEIEKGKFLKAQLIEHQENLQQTVDERTKELALVNDSLRVEVKEREKAEQKLKEHAERLEQINRELEQFSHISSHHLQEPLRKIISLGELLEKTNDPNLNQKTKRYIGHLIDSSRRMKNIIEDLLLFISIDRSTPEKVWVDPNAIMQTVLSGMERDLRRTGARIKVEYLPKLWADSKELTLVMTHILENCLKFRKSDRPVIRIWAEARGDEWIIAVRDNGIGIEPEYHEKVFELFQRLHPPDKYPGTGIGLALCKKVIGRHGGKIWMESVLNEGSTFRFSIPPPVNLDLQRSNYQATSSL